MEYWYSPSNFSFKRDAILWAIGYLTILRDGEWPREPRETGYYGNMQNKQVNKEAKFIKPASIAAEIDIRLEKCGTDGLLLEYTYTNGGQDRPYLIPHIAKLLNIVEEHVDLRCNRALSYISGWKRKKVPYSTYRDRHK